jgi:uncharacterized protein
MVMSADRIGNSVHVLAKPVGAACNLACGYCFYKNKGNTNQQPQLMSDKVLEAYIKQLIEMEPSDQVVIAWQGGEPTLANIDFYKKAVQVAAGYLPKNKTIQWTMQTNGVLLNDDWCRFFRENDFLVGVSLDGPKTVHDAFRVDRGGSGSFEAVMNAVMLLRRHRVEFNVLCCVHSANMDRALEVYRFLRDTVGARYIQFIPVIERLSEPQQSEGKCPVSSRSVGSAQWGKFLIEVFDEWVQRDVSEVFVLLFDWTLASWVGMESPACIFQENCGEAVVLERSGNVYGCDHFVDAAHLLGNILETPLPELCRSSKQLEFGHQKSHLPNACVECEYRFACNGECPKNRWGGLNYLCEGYKNFFAHTAGPMQKMANLILTGHSAAEIMNTKMF